MATEQRRGKGTEAREDIFNGPGATVQASVTTDSEGSSMPGGSRTCRGACRPHTQVGESLPGHPEPPFASVFPTGHVSSCFQNTEVCQHR